MPKINFSAVATTYAVREAGDIEATFVGFELIPASKASGQPAIKMTWSEQDSPNKMVIRTYSLQPKALWSLKRDMIHMGASIEDMNSEEADIEDILNALIGAANILTFGEPTPAQDATGKAILNEDGNQKMYENFKGVRDPSKVGV